jgi:dTDP-4-amino-4,6-dideoxygalactose transaminase
LRKFENYVIERRHFANELYKIFKTSNALELPFQTDKTAWPFFPIKFQSPEQLLKFQDELFEVAQTRRYYYPSMSEGYKGKGKTLRTSDLRVSVDLAVTSLCFPVIPSLEKKDKDRYFDKVRDLIKSLPEN